MTPSQKAKDRLLEVRRLDKLISMKQNEICHLRNKLYYKGVSYGERIQGGHIANQREELLTTILDYEAELTKDIDNLIDAKKNLSNLIENLEDPDFIDVLYKRYFEYKNWEVIAVEKNMSIRQIFRVHGKALYQFYNVMNAT